MEVPYLLQSYEDIMRYGKTLYYWKGSSKEQNLRDGGDGPVAQELYFTNSKGILSNDELIEDVKNNKGIVR